MATLIKSFLTLPFIMLCLAAQNQCLVPGNVVDTAFPVTNNFVERPFSSPNDISREHVSVFNIQKHKNIYYLFGNFTNLSTNQGQALVIDSATHAVITPQKWRINGLVNTVIPDGQGGFYIGGNFTKIGDSTRRFLARINSGGQPTAWNPGIDGIVRSLYKRNDTLFIAGAFSNLAKLSRPRFAMYSLINDSVLNAGNHILLRSYESVNSFAVYNDTLVFGAHSASASLSPVRKFSFKNNQFLPWQLLTPEYGEILSIQISTDTSTIVYTTSDNNGYVKGIDRVTGGEKYKIDVAMDFPSFTNGVVYGLKLSGTRAYACGWFDYIRKQNTRITRKGFFAFDVNTGNLFDNDLQLNGYPVFLNVASEKLYLSGRFTKLGNSSKENFAVLDTATLSLQPETLAPTDPLTCMAFSGGRLFVAGYFNGINAVHRDGFAAIDANTNTILPWSPKNTSFSEGKRMMTRGDTLFLLAITSRPSSCMVGDYNTLFQVMSLTTGEYLEHPDMKYSRMDDFTIEGDYLYVSKDRQLRRYSLPSLVQDEGWGINFAGAGSEHNPAHLLIKDNRIYSVGDNRFVQPCTNLRPRKGWFIVSDKASGLPLNYYSYEGASNLYDEVVFDHAELSTDRIFVQGYFSQLNGKPRKDFVALNINNGSITEWNPTFANAGNNSGLRQTSDLHLYNGKLWFGSSNFTTLNNGRNFPGIGALDTATGNLMPAIMNLQHKSFGIDRYNINIASSPSTQGATVKDFFFDDSYLTIAGNFELVNGNAVQNIARVKLKTGSLPGVLSSSIAGADTLYLNSDLNKYYMHSANLDSLSYNWSYTGSGVEIINNGYDTVWLKVSDNATNGLLKLTPQNYCGTGTSIQKLITLVIAPSADLIVKITGAPANATAGVLFPIRFIESNRGTSPAKPHQVNFYLSQDNILTPNANGDILLGQYSSAISLPVNTSSDTLLKNLSLPCSIANGNYYVLVMADGENSTAESNENNNTDAAPIAVVVYDPPNDLAITAAPSAKVCSPATITLTAVSTCTCGYLWSNGLTGKTITVNSSGTYTVNISNGCGTRQAALAVTISPVPATPAIATQSGATLTAAVAGDAYQWYLAGVALPGETNRTVTVKVAGLYTYTYTLGGCVSTMSPPFNALTTSVVDITNGGAIITFSPNPANKKLFITGLNVNEEYNIQIVSNSGNQVNNFIKERMGAVMEVNVSRLAAGTYVVKIYNLTRKREVGNEKILVMH